MRVTYRKENNKDYWTNRWESIPADEPMENQGVYPLKYASMTVVKNDGPILEAGCGAGRILRYFHNRGFDITGFDFIEVAINKLKKVDKSLKVQVGDITNLRYKNEKFKYLLAFGLYHNLETGLETAVYESWRVLKKEGKICASFRADNLQTKITDYWTAFKQRNVKSVNPKTFHKMNLTRKEFVTLFEQAGFEVVAIYPVENMPILYKFQFFRAKKHKKFDENIARSEGYKLSSIGKIIQNSLMYFFPFQFCNVYVLIAKKK